MNLASRPLSGTGGNWKKSPVITNWIPPNGRSSFRNIRARASNLSNIVPSTMETMSDYPTFWGWILSSMIKTLVRRHRSNAFLFFLIFLASSGTASLPNPKPAKEWSVMPPTLHAARPVDAVTATDSGFRSFAFFKAVMISRNNTDLPVPARSTSGQSQGNIPALPVKNTLFLSSTTSFLTLFCSSLRNT